MNADERQDNENVSDLVGVDANQRPELYGSRPHQPL